MHGMYDINPLNAELNPICHLLAFLGAHHILHVSRVRIKIVQYSCDGSSSSVGRVHPLPVQRKYTYLLRGCWFINSFKICAGNIIFYNTVFCSPL